MGEVSGLSTKMNGWFLVLAAMKAEKGVSFDGLILLVVSVAATCRRRGNYAPGNTLLRPGHRIVKSQERRHGYAVVERVVQPCMQGLASEDIFFAPFTATGGMTIGFASFLQFFRKVGWMGRTRNACKRRHAASSGANARLVLV